MSIYRDKSAEEVRGIVERYLQAHTDRTGNPVDTQKLKEELKALRNEKIKQDFESVFGTLSAKSIQLCIKELEELDKANVGDFQNFGSYHTDHPQKDTKPPMHKKPDIMHKGKR